MKKENLVTKDNINHCGEMLKLINECVSEVDTVVQYLRAENARLSAEVERLEVNCLPASKLAGDYEALRQEYERILLQRGMELTRLHEVKESRKSIIKAVNDAGFRIIFSPDGHKILPRESSAIVNVITPK